MYGLNTSRQPDGAAQGAIHLGEYRKMSPGPIEEWIFFDHPSGRNRILAAMRQVLGLPAHGGEDAVAATGMVEGDPLLDRPRAHLAGLAEVNGGLREAIGLTAGVQTVHVGLALLRAGHGVVNRGQYEEEDRAQEEDQRQHGGVANVANLPSLSPAPQRPLQRPLERAEPDHDQYQELDDRLAEVLEHHMRHLLVRHTLAL